MIDTITYKVTNVEVKEMQKLFFFLNEDDNENDSYKKDKYDEEKGERWNKQQQQRQNMKLYNNTNLKI